MRVGSPIQPWDEAQAAVVAPPFQLVDRMQEFRLIAPLREAAETRNPEKILALAAAQHWKAQRAATTEEQEAGAAMGDALADLAATGRASYAALGNGVDMASLEDRTRALLTGEAVQPTGDDIRAVIGSALNRAYAVAWALRGPVAQRAALRAPLGWIAVSAEDDTPHRPVNMPAPPYEQYEIPVTVRGRTLRTRFFIASAEQSPAAPVPPQARALPPDPTPSVPANHEVLLFLHGHSSGAEEALDIVPHLLEHGIEREKKYAIVSLDLPNNGYSETFHHTEIAPTSASTFPFLPSDRGPIATPVLDFIEDFVVAFVDALDAITPIKNRFAAVIGGSLGGNLALRLGRRDRTNSPWLGRAIVSWSPASVWKPMVQHAIRSYGPRHCFAECEKREADDSRVTYFQDVYEKSQAGGIIPPQPEHWYRKGWDQKHFNIRLSRIARQEIYNEHYRLWHWRVAGEQLIYSHFDNVDHEDGTTPVRYTLNTVRMLLAAGEDDNYTGTGIYDATKLLGSVMVNTPGRLLLARDTGHSLHIERPRWFANEIVTFLNAKSMQVTCVTRENGRIERLGGTNRTDDVPFDITEGACIRAIQLAEAEFFVVGADGSSADVRIGIHYGKGVGKRRTFLTTYSNTSKADNLRKLPKCPPSEP